MRLSSGLRAGMVAFLTAAATLCLQVLVHRLVSAKLLNNYAFFVISLTMLGFGMSGVILTRLLRRVLASLDDSVATSAALFALTTVLACWLFCGADSPTAADNRPAFVLDFLRGLPVALVFTVPFAFAGMILGALLSSPALPTRSIYGADLVGSAVGAFGVVPLIRQLGVEAGILAVCGVLLLGALAASPPRHWAARSVSALASLVLALTAIHPAAVFEMRYPGGTVLSMVQGLGDPYAVEHVAWDPVARIEVSRIPPPEPDNVYSCLTGSDPRFLARFKRMLTQNNYAATYAVEYDGTMESLSGVGDTIYAAAYQAGTVPQPRVLVIGVGGGFDVLTALAFQAGAVTGVEINSATVDILTRTYRGFFRTWVEDPRVRLVLADGRHFLEASADRYDVIQLSGVDSYSGTPAAAHVFSENYLYTREAMRLFLDRLTERGVLNLMRLERQPPREMLRVLATAVETLREMGVADPARRVVMISSRRENFSAMLVKRSPFEADELRRLSDWAGRSPLFYVSAAPGGTASRGPYQVFLMLGDAGRERAFVHRYPFDISPVSDDRPFFFRFSRWWHLFPSAPVVWAAVPVMEYSFLMLFTLVGAAVVVCIYLPLRLLDWGARRTARTWRYAVFFAGTGLGYLAIEVALLQKFGLFLGHPNYALSTVLAALLATSGLGSLFAAGIVASLGRVRHVSYLLSGLILGEHLLILPRLNGWIGFPFWIRVVAVCVLVAPVGLCLGVFVPSALTRLKAEAPAFVPWAWGINGIFSVLAPVLGVAVSMTWGISALFLSAVPVYLVAGFSLPDGDGVAGEAAG